MEDIQRVLRAAGIRLLAIDLVRTLTVCATLAVGALFLTRIFQKLVPVALPWTWLFIGAGVAAVIGAVAWSLVRRARGVALARIVDERADLRETLSTALCVERADDPWSRAVVAAAAERARTVRVRHAIPMQPPRAWPALACAVLALVAVWWVPGYDVTGLLAQREQEDADEAAIRQVQLDVEARERRLEEVLSRAGVEIDRDEDEGARDREELERPRRPEEIRRAAIRRLTNLGDRLEMESRGDRRERMDGLRRAMERIRPPGPGPLSEMSRSLARGNFGEARRQLEQLAAAMADGSMSEQDRERLAAQLENLARQLEELAQRREDLERSLREAGLSADEARRAAQSPEALERALERMEGLSEEQKEQLRREARRLQAASEACEGMGGALSQMAAGLSESGFGQGGMAGLELLAGQLSELEMLAQDLQALDVAMDELSRELAELGRSMQECPFGGCEGGQCAGGDGQCAGGIGTCPEAHAGGFGMGSGEPGRGSGQRFGDDEDGLDYAVERRRVRGQDRGGPIIGRMMIHGASVRGESRAEFESAAGAARAEAAEAIETRRVPREYEQAVQHYFGRLEARAREAERGTGDED